MKRHLYALIATVGVTAIIVAAMVTGAIGRPWANTELPPQMRAPAPTRPARDRWIRKFPKQFGAVRIPVSRGQSALRPIQLPRDGPLQLHLESR